MVGDLGEQGAKHGDEAYRQDDEHRRAIAGVAGCEVVAARAASRSHMEETVEQ